MLHLINRVIPAPLHRLAFRAAYRARKLWLRLSQAENNGCSEIARDYAGRVLLVRHSYGPPVWTFPGGGMHKGEEPEAAALREFAEELDAAIIDPQHLGTLRETYLGGTNNAHVFTGVIAGEPRPDMREVVEARFFARDDLPSNTSRTVQARLQLLDQQLQQR